MRIATEKEYEIQPTDGVDLVASDLLVILNQLREVNPEHRQRIKLMLDIETL